MDSTKFKYAGLSRDELVTLLEVDPNNDEKTKESTSLSKLNKLDSKLDIVIKIAYLCIIGEVLIFALILANFIYHG